jgi:hypothetical protein
MEDGDSIKGHTDDRSNTGTESPHENEDKDGPLLIDDEIMRLNC